MTTEERNALVRGYLGKTVYVRIERPIGYLHKNHGGVIEYEVNYGFIPGVIGGDGEELDVYVIGVPERLSEFRGRVAAIVFRRNDEEDKLIAVPDDYDPQLLNPESLMREIEFAEKYYDSYIVTE